MAEPTEKDPWHSHQPRQRANPRPTQSKQGNTISPTVNREKEKRMKGNELYI